MKTGLFKCIKVHTIGHAVEGASDYSIIHGLAVSIGMVAAAKLAVSNDLLTEWRSAKVSIRNGDL